MKKLTLFLTVIFLSAVFIIPAHPAIRKLAQTGLQFLEVDVSPHAAAMGDAFLMVGNDANAMFYNPAGIAKMQSEFDFFAGHTRWIADISYNAGGIVKNMGNWGSVGLSFITANYGNIIGTRVASNDKGFIETGNVSVGAYAFGLAYARRLTDKFSVGGQIKYVSQHLGENLFANGSTVKNKVSGLAYDFGTIFYPGFKSFRFGMSVRNFSPQFKYQETPFQLPLTFRIGFAMDVLDLMGEHSNSLLIDVDAIHPRDYTERINIGGEYWFRNIFAIRGGYKFNYEEQGLTAGFGFKKDVAGFSIKMDYAYQDFGVFSNVNRVSFGLSF